MDDVTQAIIKQLLVALNVTLLGPKKHFYCYLPQKGGCPAREFLDSRSDEAKAQYLKLFTYHREGHILRGDKWKELTDGIYEYKNNSDKSRLLYVPARSGLHVLLLGFGGKKENKVEPGHVGRAKEMRNEYEARAKIIENSFNKGKKS